MDITVRIAEPTDADAIADAHVWGWRVGYRGLFPDEYLDSEDFDQQRRERWRQWVWHDYGGPRSQLFVSVADGRVVGFGHAGPARVSPVCDASGSGQRTELSDALGEVYGFYLHPDAWGSGAASALMLSCESHLRDEGFGEACLWVLRDNPRARRFYERAGWRATGLTGDWPGPQSSTGPGQLTPEVEYRRTL